MTLRGFGVDPLQDRSNKWFRGFRRKFKRSSEISIWLDFGSETLQLGILRSPTVELT